MENSLEQHVLNQSPFAALFTGMVLLGSLINQKANVSEVMVNPKSSWCQNSTILADFIAPMPKGLGVATIVVTIVFPMVPILANSYSKTWNKFKVNLIKSHVVGQGSVFGVSEFLRHFITLPEPLFLSKCNITVQDCLVKSQFSNISFVNFSEAFNNTNTSFCHLNDNNYDNELFNSLHHFPDKICCFIGASIVTFLTTLYFWNRINKKGKSLYDAHSVKQCFLIIFQVVSITLILIYLYFLFYAFENFQVMGIFIGGVIQLMIYLSTLSKQDVDVFILPNNTKNINVTSLENEIVENEKNIMLTSSIIKP